MIRYTVIWQDEAIEDVAALWLDASDPAVITTGCNTIQKLLSLSPEIRGTEMREGLRSLTVWPLRAIFAVREEDRIIEVWRVLAVDDT